MNECLPPPLFFFFPLPQTATLADVLVAIPLPKLRGSKMLSFSDAY